MRIRSFRHKGLRRLYETGSRRGIRSDLVEKVEDILHAIEQARRVEQWDFSGMETPSTEGSKAWRVECLGERRLSDHISR